MATKASARAATPDAAGTDDYAALCATLSETARGRAFLAEYARRNRSADTEVLLAALTRLEAMVRADCGAVERLRDELQMVLVAIRLARPDIDAASPPTKVAKLASLLEMLERRIETIADTKIADAAPLTDEPVSAPTKFSVVPPPDEPELPIPTPASDQTQLIALVRTPDAMPAITFFVNAPPKTEAAEALIVEPAAEAPIVASVTPVPKTAAALPPVNPLAAIMALSEAERIALFT